MSTLTGLFSSWSGYRTYLASAGSLLMAAAMILTALATAAGVLCPTTGFVTGATLMGLALKFQSLAAMAQRLATAKTEQDLLAAIDELKNGGPPPEPVVLKLFDDSTPSANSQPEGAHPA